MLIRVQLPSALPYEKENNLLSMVYEEYKIYGPYVRKDKRSMVVTVHKSGRKSSVSYPKYLVEKSINRYLKKDETVDHIDGDFENNELSNFRVLIRSEHIKQEAKRLKVMGFICPICNKKFELSNNKLSIVLANNKREKAGPFCSKKCIGIYGTNVQYDKSKLKIVPIKPEYYTLKSSLKLLEVV